MDGSIRDPLHLGLRVTRFLHCAGNNDYFPAAFKAAVNGVIPHVGSWSGYRLASAGVAVHYPPSHSVLSVLCVRFGGRCLPVGTLGNSHDGGGLGFTAVAGKLF